MSNLLRTCAFFTTSLMIGCATGPSGESFDSPIGKWSEQWESPGGTNTSRLTIFDETSGKYSPPYDSRVEFHAIDRQRTWKGIWMNDGPGSNSCNEEKGGSKNWGETLYQFNETYNRYKGNWDFCGEGPKYATSGVR